VKKRERKEVESSVKTENSEKKTQVWSFLILFLVKKILYF